MANSKISELPLATTISLTDLIPIVSGSTTKKATVQTLYAQKYFDKYYTTTTQTSSNVALEEKIFSSILIPANTLSDGKIIEIQNAIVSLSSNSAWTVSCWFSPTLTINTGIKIGEFASTATVYWKNFKRTLWTRSGQLIGLNNATSAISDDDSLTNQQPPVSSQTINYAVQNYFYWTVIFTTSPIGSVRSEIINTKIY